MGQNYFTTLAARSLCLGLSTILWGTVTGCTATAPPTQSQAETGNIVQNSERVTLTGVVIKKPWTKNAESWNAGGGDYYVLDVGDAQVADRSAEEGVILRASDEVSMEEFEAFIGDRVQVEGEYVEAQPYEPESPMESYPTGMDGKPLPRGSGFQVYQIIEME